LAERQISTRFKIEGEAEYKNAVKGINNELKTLSSEMAKTQSEFQTQANSYEALAKKGEVLAKQQEAQARKVAEMRDALENSRAAHEQYGAALEEQKASVEALRERLEALKDAEGDTSAEQEKLTAELEKAERAQDAAQRAYDESGKSVDYWQRSLNYAERDLNNLDAEIQKNNQYLGEAQKSADGCATSIDKYGKAAGQAGGAMETLGQVGQAALGSLGQFLGEGGLVAFAVMLIDKIKEVAVEANKANSIMVQGTGASTEALQELNEVYKDVMGNVKSSGDVVAGVIASLNTRLGLTGDELTQNAELFEKFGRAAKTDAAQSVGKVVDMLNAFGGSAEDIPRTLDLLITAAQNSDSSVLTLAQSVTDCAIYAREYGYSLEEIIAIMAAAEQAQGGLSSMMSKAMKKSFEEITESGKDFNQVMAELKDGTLSAEDAVDLFGNKSANVAQYLRNGTLDIEAMTKSMEGADGRMVRTAKDAETWTQKLKGFWNELFYGPEMIGTQYEGFYEVVTDGAEDAAESLQKVSGATAEVGMTLYGMVEGFDGTSAALQQMINYLQDGDGQMLSSKEGYDTFLGTLKDLERGYESLEAEQAKVRAEVHQTVESLTANFNDLSNVTAKDVGDMIKALSSQEKYMQDYAANMQAAAKRGVNDGLLKTLQDGSVQSAAILAGLATATDEQIDELNAQWEKTEEGKQTFEDTLTEMQGEFSKKAAELEDRYRQTVDSFNRESEAAAAGAKTLQGVLRGAASVSAQVNATMYNYGRLASESYIAGFTNGNVPTGRLVDENAPTFAESAGVKGQGIYPDVIGAIDNVTDAVNNQTPIAWDTFQQNVDLGLGQGAKMNRLAGG
jgi:phage-related minor tail protein